MNLKMNQNEFFPVRENLHSTKKQTLNERTKVVYNPENDDTKSKRRRRIKRVHTISEKI